MKRVTPIPDFNPSDLNPIPAPKLTFGRQTPNKSFPTGGLFSRGFIKFNINNKQMVDLAGEAFSQNSSYKDDANALTCFLSSLQVTANFEGGFDAINTYDNAGISVGFLQFARPEGGAGKLLEMIGRNDLAKTIKERFGTSDPHKSASALEARFDEALLREVITAAASPEGIKAQFAMAVNKNVDGQCYFDKAYAKYLQLNLKDPISCNLLFDCAVNMGVGSLSKFQPCEDGADGDWLARSVNLHKREERQVGWKKILNTNFA